MKKTVTTLLAILTLCTVMLLPSKSVNAASGAYPFVSQLYKICMGRAGSTDEIRYWANELSDKKTTACTVVYDFVFSDEFQSKNMSNEEYVTCMYQLFMRREPASAEINYWASCMDNGMDREQVFAGFANSPEFNSCCEENSISTGVYISGYDRSQVLKVNLFMDRLYERIMGRRCDTDGMIFWTKSLINKEVSGKDVVTLFVNAPEFISLGTTNENYVSRIYRVMLDRTAYSNEISYWADAISNGGSRDDVIQGFAASPEFFALCLNSGIDNGALVTGWVMLDQNYYFVDSMIYTGWLDQDNKRYYIDNGLMVTSWYKLEDNWYYFDSNGVMQTGMWVIRGVRYYFFDNGVMATGWQEVNDHWYYFKDDGAAITGEWFKYNGDWYYFDGAGLMRTGFTRIDGVTYYFTETGVMVTGWYNHNGYWRYFDPSGGEYISRWLNEDGYWYYFDPSGIMVTGHYMIGEQEYLFDNSGHMVTGWVKSEGHLWYYTENGRDYSRTGFQLIDGHWYYIYDFGNDYGVYVHSDYAGYEGKRYYFNEDGTMYTGWRLAEYENYITGDIYYDLEYFHDDGAMATNEWLTYNGGTVYIDASGSAAIGRRTIGDNEYYFDDDYHLVRNQDVLFAGDAWHVGSEATETTHTHYHVYHADANGVLTYVRTDCSLAA